MCDALAELSDGSNIIVGPDITMDEWLRGRFFFTPAQCALADALFANDRCTSVRKAGVRESQIAETQWVYGEKNYRPATATSLEPLVKFFLDGSDAYNGKCRSSVVRSTSLTDDCPPGDSTTPCDIFGNETRSLNVWLECQVTHICYDDKQVRISIKGRSQVLRCTAAIISVPLPILKRQLLRFDPPLGRAKLAAINTLQADRIVKLFLYFERSLAESWPFGMQSCCCANSLLPEVNFIPEYQSGKIVRILLVGFVTSDAASHLMSIWKAGGMEAVVSRALQQIEALIACEKANSVVQNSFMAAHLYDWGSHPHVFCGYSSPSIHARDKEFISKHGQHARAILARPIGASLFFCGEATSLSVDGALFYF